MKNKLENLIVIILILTLSVGMFVVLGKIGEQLIIQAEFSQTQLPPSYRWFSTIAADLQQQRERIIALEQQCNDIRKEYQFAPISSWEKQDQENYKHKLELWRNYRSEYNDMALRYNKVMIKAKFPYTEGENPLPKQFPLIGSKNNGR